MSFALWHLVGAFHITQTLGHASFVRNVLLALLQISRPEQSQGKILMNIGGNTKMGRKPKDREITYKNFIGIKLSDQQLEYLQTEAKRLGVSQSEYIRRLLTDKPLQIRYEVVADSEELTKLVHEFGKIGTNLNQIALHFNTGGTKSRIMEDEIHEAIAKIFEMRKEVLKLGGDFSGSTKTHRK